MMSLYTACECCDTGVESGELRNGVQCVEGQDMLWGAKLPCQVQITLKHLPVPSPRHLPDQPHMLGQVQALNLFVEHRVSRG